MIKVELIMPISAIFSLVIGFTSTQYVLQLYRTYRAVIIDVNTLFSVFLGLFTILILHELFHYIFIRYVIGKPAKIERLLRYGAIAVTFDELRWDEYVLAALAPQFVIEVPLVMVWLALQDIVTCILAVLHLSLSIPDIANSIRYMLLHRDSTIILCRDDGRLVGYAVVENSGECTIYRFKLRV